MNSTAVALTLALSLASVGLADTIRLVPGSKVDAPGGQLSGQITAEGPAEVTIKPATGAERKVPVDQIDSITYDGLTPSFTLAESRENAGLLTEAAELYGKAADEAQGKPLIERAAQYGRARVLADLGLADPGKADDALKALEDFLKTHPNSRQVGQALQAVVRISLQKGDTSRAESALNDLAARVPAFADRVEVLRARVSNRKGQHDEAVSALDTIIAEAPEGSAQAREALLAKAEALVDAEKFEEAEQAVRRVITSAPPEDATIQAEAHNVLGDCLRAANRPKDALMAYLKTDILYDRNKEQHPRALARIAQTWGDLKQTERQAEVLERLRLQYPQSPYARGPAVAPR